MTIEGKRDLSPGEGEVSGCGGTGTGGPNRSISGDAMTQCDKGLAQGCAVVAIGLGDCMRL